MEAKATAWFVFRWLWRVHTRYELYQKPEIDRRREAAKGHETGRTLSYVHYECMYACTHVYPLRSRLISSHSTSHVHKRISIAIYPDSLCTSPRLHRAGMGDMCSTVQSTPMETRTSRGEGEHVFPNRAPRAHRAGWSSNITTWRGFQESDAALAPVHEHVGEIRSISLSHRWSIVRYG